jgi:hypothetical protein
VSPALRFKEEMAGYVAFGDLPPASGGDLGRKEGTRLQLRMVVIVDDVDRFIAGPERRALLRGSVTFEELGGSFEIERGQVRLLPGRGDRSGRMYYSIGVRAGDEEWLTFRGVKFLTHRRGTGAIVETTSMHMRVLRGEPDTSHTEDDPAPGERELTVATGVVRLTAGGFVRGLASFRPRARSRRAGAIAIARFWASLAGAIADVYIPRPKPDEGLLELEPPPAIEPPRRPVARRAITVRRPVDCEQLNESDWQYGLRVDRYNLDDEDVGTRVWLEHVVRPDVEETPPKGPVLLIAGSSVGASIFRPAGVETTVIHYLIDLGYDVWVENWRGSLGSAPVEYSLDEAAVLDHPRAVAQVAKQTESKEVKAVVHCLGSSGFMLALAGGLLHTDEFSVTHVVSNSVSLHPVLPHTAEQKLRGLIPVYNRLIPYLDPQWAREPAAGEPMTDRPLAQPDASGPGATPRGAVADVILNWVKLTHRECEDPVANFGQFMYGSGPSTLYEERHLTPETRTWMRDQLAWAPIRLYRQISRSLMAGHLVPMREWADALPENLFEDGPADRMTAKITFITGSDNRCFSPLSQRRTHEWFSAFQPNRHDFVPIDGFGHLDVWLRPDAEPVHEAVRAGLEPR